MWSPNPPVLQNVTVFGGKAVTEVTEVKGGRKGGALNMTGVLIRRGRGYQGFVYTEERPCEDMARRQLSARQGRRPQEEPVLLTP